jgi:hypothetical protein
LDKYNAKYAIISKETWFFIAILELVKIIFKNFSFIELSSILISQPYLNNFVEI